MTDIASLLVKIEADTEDLNRDLARAKKGMGDFEAVTKNSQKQLAGFTKTAKAAGKVLGAFVVAALTKNLISTNVEFEKLRTSLITVTGNAEDANTAFDGIKQFAATTPFAVQEVTDAFIKLGNLGLAPSKRALTSYGNTAGAMGKSLNQMVEAVADSVTGEFERLKLFGIKAKKEGDKVKFIFKGVTTEVGNNAKEIEDFLIGIGEVEFAGGMVRQADTLGGAFSNLAGSWASLLDTLISENTSGILGSFIRRMGATFDGLSSLITGLDESTKLSLEVMEEMEKLDELLRKQADAGDGYFGFFDADSFNDDIAEQTKIVDDLTASYFKLTAPVKGAGKSFDELAESLGKAGEAAPEMSKELSKALDKASKDADSTTKEFQKLFDSITAPAKKEDEDVTTLDIGLLEVQAETAIDQGNFDEAVTKAKEAFGLLEQMKEAGTISDTVALFWAQQLQEIGEKAGDGIITEVQMEIDKEAASAKALNTKDAIQKDIDASGPIVLPFVFEFGAGDIDFKKPIDTSIPAAERVKSEEQLIPTIINLANGEQATIFGDKQNIDTFAESVQEEATKRGTR